MFVMLFTPLEAATTVGEHGGEEEEEGEQATAVGDVQDPQEQLPQWIKKAAGGNTVRFQCYPRKLEQWCVERAMECGVSAHPKEFTHVLHVVKGSDTIHVGCSAREEWYQQSTRYTAPDLVARSQLKLQEVVRMAGIEVAPTWKCLDVGASPGGWTSCLAPLVPEGMVVAVDPAEMRIECASNMVFIRARLDECMDALRETAPFDMLVCDACGEPRDTASWLAPAFALLRAGGICVLTVKCIKKGNKGGLITLCKDLLEEHGITDVSAHWLLSNTSKERTLVARKN